MGMVDLPKGRECRCSSLSKSSVHPTDLILGLLDVQGLQPQLDCGAKEIKVKLDKCLLGGLGFNEEIIAYLNDRNCSGIMQNEPNNWVSMTSPVLASDCGNILEVSGIHTSAARG